MFDQRLRTVLRVTVSLALLAFVVRSVGVDSFADALATVSPRILLVALGLSVVNVAVSTYKWGLLLRIKGIDVPFRTLVNYYYVGKFFNAFLPTNIGGDGVRVYYLHDGHDAGPDSVSSVVVERLTGLLTVLVLAGVASVFLLGRLPTAVVAAVFLVFVPGGVVLFGLLFTDAGRRLFERTLFRVERFGLGERVADAYGAIHAYRDAGRALVPVFALSVLYRLLLVVNHFLVALALGIHVPVVYFLAFVPLVELLLAAPVSIQGFGVREVSYVYLFGAVGVASGLALTLGVLMQLVLTVFNNVLGGLVYLANGDGIDRAATRP